VPLRGSFAEEHVESKQMVVVSQLSKELRDMSQSQQVNRKKNVVKSWSEE